MATACLRYIFYRALMLWAIIKCKCGLLTARKLEIGSGPVRRQGWISLDHCRGADLVWDLRKMLPIPSNTMDAVYASHVLEHFSFRDLNRLLSEIHRVLRPGGEFFIAVPDASLYVRIYNGELAATDYLRYQPAQISHLRMDALNYIFFMNGHHRFMFDSENLAFHCSRNGFMNCEVRAFNPELDSQERAYESLYMKCQKPASTLKQPDASFEASTCRTTSEAVSGSARNDL